MKTFKQYITEKRREYPLVGKSLEGLKVTDNIPNISSIKSSLYDYRLLVGVRKLPFKDFGGPRSVFYAADDFEKSRVLSREIEINKYIDPLIVVIDEKGPYILEGAHRFVALYNLKKKYFPALVVMDLDNLQEDKESNTLKKNQYLTEAKTITAYHGSNVPIKKFDPKKGNQGVMWFSEDKDKILKGDSGAASSKYIMTVKLTVSKTAGWDEYEKLGLGQIEDQGFDSILLDDDWIIFDGKNVKVKNVEERENL